MKHLRVAVPILACSLFLSCSAFRTLEPSQVRYPLEPCKTVNAADGDVRVCDEGKGDVVVLLHGLFGSVEVWSGWAAKLKDSHRVIRIDLPGNGLSTPYKDGRYSVERDGKVVLAVLKQLGVREFAVAGSSAGGFVAWYLAQTNTAGVTKLILVSSIGLDPEPGRIDRLPRFIRALGRIAVPLPLLRLNLPRSLSEETVLRYYDLGRLRGNRGATVDRLNAPWRDYRDGLARIRVPTLILWGRDDRALDPDDACRFANRIPSSRLVVVPGVGHLMMEEAPEETAEVALRFLKGEALNLPNGWSTSCHELKASRRIPPVAHGGGKHPHFAMPKPVYTFEGMDVFCEGREGPPILLLHELPGLTPETFWLARRLAGEGYTVYMPHLFGTPGKHSTMRNMLPIVFGWDWLPFRDATPPVAGKLRRLALKIHAEHTNQRMGVIGMCLTGNLPPAFLDAKELPFVQAAVMSQPSLPLLRPSQLALSKKHLEAAKATGVEILGFRFSHDEISPWERRVALQRFFGNQIDIHVLDSSPWNHDGYDTKAHAVLTEEMFDEHGNPSERRELVAAWETLVRYLAKQLKR